MHRLFVAAAIITTAALTAACGSSTPMKAAEPAQSVFFVEPKDGATLPTEFKVVFGAKGWLVRPLGDMTAGTGHHHLLINATAVDKGVMVPLDKPDTVMHFGKGQTETMVKLAPGTYRLQMQMGDGAHISLGESARATINVTVK
jgi:Domain of unknown function (DUF4399)